MTRFYTAVVDASGRPEGGASTTLVPWWSFTKTLIAAAALRLAEQGRLRLDEPLDGLPYTLRQVLQHRAGIDDYFRLPAYVEAVARRDDPWTDDALLARIPPIPRRFAPGTGWAYSNVGYLLACRAIERAHGAGLNHVLRQLVLEPLDLRAARVTETPEDMAATVFAGGHGYHPGWVFHGVVVGPVVEAALALHRLLTGDPLSPASRAVLLDRHPIWGPLPGRPWTATGYGLGLMMGRMRRPGMAGPLTVAGHSAGGPSSAGTVYHGLSHDNRRTAAAFVSGSDEGSAEDAALACLDRPSGAGA